jgi:1,2-phenylacetyl-CoA epoxidase catalytic subunit
MRRCWKRNWRLPNMALDLLGQASALYAYAGTVEGKGRDEDHWPSCGWSATT